MPVTRDDSRPLGVVYTPADVARAMTRLALQPLVEAKSSTEILALRICDPAAGTGAFLVEVVAYLAGHLVAAWRREGRGIGLATASAQESPASAQEARTLVARSCIVGVDIDESALLAAARSLGLDNQRGSHELDHEVTGAARNDGNLRVADALALDWRAAFPHVFANGGFDVVLANPPYIRQESLASKASLEAFEVYDGVADLYVYFIELAHRLLRPRGRYCVIVPSKWMTVDYGRPLRRFLVDAFTVDGIADLSTHALFANADAFPCIVWGTAGGSRDRAITGVRATNNESVEQVLQRAVLGNAPSTSFTDFSNDSSNDSSPTAPTASSGTSATDSATDSSPTALAASSGTSATDSATDSSPTALAASSGTPTAAHPDQLAPSDSDGVRTTDIPRDRWTAEPWHIDSSSDRMLLDRLAHYPTLGEIIGTRWSRGVVTGLNEAFVIDRATRDRLVATDLACAAWIRPFIKGRDIRPFVPSATERWLVLVDRGTTFDLLPPPIRAHLARFRDRLEPKPADHAGAWTGRKTGSYAWYELQDPVVPLAKSRDPRLFYQDIQTVPACSFDPDGELVPDTTVWILPSRDRYLLAILNSRVYGWYAQRRCPPALNGAVRPKLAYMQRLPIPTPSADLRREIEAHVTRRLVANEGRERDILDRQIERFVELAYEVSSIERALIAT